jgi:hypothetical protein
LLASLLTSLLPSQGYQVLAPQDFDLSLPQQQVERIESFVRGTALRGDGIKVYDTRNPLNFDDAKVLKENLIDGHPTEEAFPPKQLIGRLTRELIAADYYTDRDPPRLYHVTNALSYTFNRTIGWVDPVDLSWLCADHLALGEYDETDTFGLYQALNPLDLENYISFRPGFYEHGEAVLGALGVDFSDAEIQRLMKAAVVLEIRPEVYQKQFASLGANAGVLMSRTHPGSSFLGYEVISPLLPSDTLVNDLGEKLVNIVAVVRPPEKP